MSGAKGLRSPRRLIRIALVAALAILVAGGIRAARKLTEAQPLAGVELGMTVDEVRTAFRPPEPGFFMVGSAEGEPLLEWHPRGRGGGAPTGARFEFEDAELVRARFGWTRGTRPDEAARQLGLALDRAGQERTWDLGAGRAELREDAGSVEIVYAAEE